MKIKAYTLSLVVLILTGCFSNHPPYPENWQETSKNNTCPALGGYYFSEGEGNEGVSVVPSLYKLLINNPLNLSPIDSIKINERDNILSVKAFSGGELREEREIAVDVKSCRNGFFQLDMPSQEGGVNRDGVVGYEWEKILLTKTPDGALIVRKDSGAVGIVLLIPVSGSAHEWYRYKEKK